MTAPPEHNAMLSDDRNDLKDWKRRTLASPVLLGRREFLRAGLGGAAALAGAGPLAGRALSAGNSHAPPEPVKTGTFYFPRLMFHVKDETGDQWNFHPVGDVILRKRLVELTNINASQEPVVVSLANMTKLCRYPFVFATSEGYFDLPPHEERNLKEFLMRGGFVFADDCVYGTKGDRFFRDYVKMIKRLFPDHEMREVPKEHELYHCYFDFPQGAPQIRSTRNVGYGLFEKGTGRIMTYVTSGDLHCGWCCMFFPKDRNEAAIRMGINVIIYYLTH